MSKTSVYEEKILASIELGEKSQLQTLFTNLNISLQEHNATESTTLFSTVKNELENINASVKQGTKQQIDAYLVVMGAKVNALKNLETTTKKALSNTAASITDDAGSWRSRFRKKAKTGKSPKDIITEEIENSVKTTTKIRSLSGAKNLALWGRVFTGGAGVLGFMGNIFGGEKSGEKGNFLSSLSHTFSDFGKMMNTRGENILSWRRGGEKKEKEEKNKNIFTSKFSEVDKKVLASFIQGREGWRERAYDDHTGKTLNLGEKPIGVATIGRGFTTVDGKKVKGGDVITKDVGRKEFEKQLNKAEFVKYISIDLSPHQKAALLSMEYNMGTGVRNRSTGKKILALMNEKKFNEAADLLVSSKIGITEKATGKVMKGLVKRRKAEAEMLKKSVVYV